MGLGIPKQTISRWKHKDLPEFLRPIVAASPELRAMARWGQALRQAGINKNGTKKRDANRYHEGFAHHHFIGCYGLISYFYAVNA